MSNYIPQKIIDVITYQFLNKTQIPRNAVKKRDTAVLHNFPEMEWLHSWWRHQMETFSALLAICAGNSPVSGEFPAQRPVTLSFDVFFDLRLNNGWVHNGEAGDLRRYRAHFDVTVMYI